MKVGDARYVPGSWTDNASTPLCPWCRDEADDTPWEIPFSDSDLFETECANCSKAILILRCVSINYSAAKLEE